MLNKSRPFRLSMFPQPFLRKTFILADLYEIWII
jgi:hypothetical protein